MTFVLVVGTTETATVDGISAAGADPEAMRYTPAADAELVAYGRPVFAPDVPVSPTGCPTPALVTRAVRDLVGFDLLVLDAGLPAETAAPAVPMLPRPGGDVRTPEPVPGAADRFERARRFGRELPAEEVVVGESIPGGTTTALGVFTALGEARAVSSSLPENPLERKRAVVEAGLEASGVEAGCLARRPVDALRLMGDPVLATVAGFVVGAVDSGTAVTLAGGTQMLAAAAIVRHAGVSEPLTVATTTFVAEDDSADLRATAADLDVDLAVADPGFDDSSHGAMDCFSRGEAKEGVGMGGALALAERDGRDETEVRERFATLYDELVGDRATERNSGRP